MPATFPLRLRALRHALRLVLLVALVWAAVPVRAQGGPGAPEVRLDQLFAALARADAAEAPAIEAEIRRIWNQTGSPTLDLLLMRAREALDAGEPRAAIEHLTALIDHAPGLAEAFSLRATAWYVEGRVGLAMADLARALALEPRHFEALAGVGVILEETGHEARALAAWRAAQAISPANADIAAAIGRLERALEGTAL